MTTENCDGTCGAESNDMCLQCTRTALQLREQEIVWYEKELEHFVEGRRVRYRSTREQRAWLAANKTVHTINVVAYEQIVHLAETLEGERDAARAYIATFIEEHRRLTQERDAVFQHVAKELATKL